MVREARGLRGSQCLAGRMLLQVLDRTLDVLKQHVGHVAAEPVPDDEADYHHIQDVRQHRIGGSLPAADPEPVGKVEQGVAGILSLTGREGDGGNALAAVSVEEELERAKLGDLLREMLGHVVAILLDTAVAFAPQPEQQVVPEK